jgi:hypothetical protein
VSTNDLYTRTGGNYSGRRRRRKGVEENRRWSLIV